MNMVMKKCLLFLLVVVALSGLTACNQAVSASYVQSNQPRDTSPSVAQADLATLVDGNSAFAFDLYQAVKGNDANILYSPYSISLALAMTYAGARNETENEMANVLHFALPQDGLHSAMDSLDLTLRSRGQGAQGTNGEGFKLNIANAIWGQEGYQFQQAFLDVLAENYGAGLRIVDFKSAPEQSRLTINNWVSNQTSDKINDLIPQGSITTLTRLVLTNAIYFDAAWASPFNKQQTQDGTFCLLDGSDVTVPMMRQTEALNYAEGDNYQAVEIPYDGNQLSMLILLPKAGQLTSFEASLNSQTVNSIINELASEEVALTMPKFQFDSSFSLKSTLSAMGMPQAFQPEVADFSGMTGNQDLFISDVVHKACISVNEAGTEAAAATGVIVGTTAMPVATVQLTIDHPFIFAIRDMATGTILFMGRVENPTQ
jgi:serpin B